MVQKEEEEEEEEVDYHHHADDDADDAEMEAKRFPRSAFNNTSTRLCALMRIAITAAAVQCSGREGKGYALRSVALEDVGNEETKHQGGKRERGRGRRDRKSLASSRRRDAGSAVATGVHKCVRPKEKCGKKKTYYVIEKREERERGEESRRGDIRLARTNTQT